MEPHWFKQRRYRHFDRPVNQAYALKVQSGSIAPMHSFSPLLRYIKQTKRYRPERHKTTRKDRPIMYAAHRDACIYSFYASQLDKSLSDFYLKSELTDNVIAYRKLGRGNYNFSADVYKFAVDHSPCSILAFDVKGFFDHLDHPRLKARLKQLLDVTEIPKDWYQVLKSVTKYHFIELKDIKENPILAERLKTRVAEPIATIKEIKKLGIPIRSNATPGSGIPQGTPISAVLSNLYLIQFDLALSAYARSVGALYRRYSDDILLICPVPHVSEAKSTVERLLQLEKLELSVDKTECTTFDVNSDSEKDKRAAQYLGFVYYPSGPGIRESSLSRQWRKMRRALKRIRRVAEEAISSGRATKVYTKNLRRRFSPGHLRNFSGYSRRGASAFGQNQKITKQVRALEREFEKGVQKVKSELEPKS